jgi:excisionase family DNA binding protein
MQLWNYESASNRLEIPVPTLEFWVSKKRIPYCKLGRLVRFDPIALQNWVQACAINPTQGSTEPND